MFRVFDINNNGIVTKKELFYAANGFDTNQIEEIIQELDPEHGDSFNMQEFVLLMKYIDQKN